MTSPSFPPEQLSTHRGVPVLRRDLPGPLTGTLHFGVGTVDEPLHQMGISHLLEHLVCAGIVDPHADHNASTEPDSVTFWAVGSPEEVAGHLNAVAVSIGRLAQVSDAAVQRERKSLGIENPSGVEGIREGLLSYRYGADGLGRADLGEASVVGVTREDVVEWGRRWLTASNAVLTFSGPVPDGLAVNLPDGPGVVRERRVPAGHPHRSLIKSEKVGVGLSFVTATAEPELVQHALAHEIVQRLRVEAGLIYSADSWTHRDDDSTWHCSFVLDPRPQDTVEATVRLVALLDELRTRPLSEAAVKAASVARRIDLEIVTAPGRHLDASAVDLLRGRTLRSLEESYEAAVGDPAGLRERLTRDLREALTTLQVAVDDDVPDDERLQSLGLTVVPSSAWTPDPTPLRGRRHRSRWHGPLGPGTVMALRADRIQGRGQGRQESIALADVVLVLRDPDGSVTVLDRRGNRACFEPGDWRRGDALITRLLERISAPVIDLDANDVPPPGR